MVVGAYFPELSGGALQCRTLVLALRDRVRFTILTTTAERDALERSEVDGIVVYRVFVDPRRLRSKLAATWRMTRLIPRLTRECDIFHFHGFTQKMLLLAAAARLAGRKTIEKLTSLGWDDPIALRTRAGGRWLAAVQRRVDRIVATTPALRERCFRAGVLPAQLIMIPNGVDVDRFAPADASERVQLRQQLGLPADGCLVTFIGFWSAEKGPDVLFKAWREARARTGLETALLFIGSTDAAHPEVSASIVRSVRTEIERDRLSSVVRMVERIDDVAPYLRASDVFALPSSREGLSNALLEAMSVGLPCICAAASSGTDGMIVSGVNGWVVPPGDADALAETLVLLIQNPAARRAAGASARDTIVERFTIASVADRYLALYRELAGASS